MVAYPDEGGGQPRWRTVCSEGEASVVWLPGFPPGFPANRAVPLCSSGDFLLSRSCCRLRNRALELSVGVPSQTAVRQASIFLLRRRFSSEVPEFPDHNRKNGSTVASSAPLIFPGVSHFTSGIHPFIYAMPRFCSTGKKKGAVTFGGFVPIDNQNERTRQRRPFPSHNVFSSQHLVHPPV